MRYSASSSTNRAPHHPWERARRLAGEGVLTCGKGPFDERVIAVALAQACDEDTTIIAGPALWRLPSCLFEPQRFIELTT